MPFHSSLEAQFQEIKDKLEGVSLSQVPVTKSQLAGGAAIVAGVGTGFFKVLSSRKKKKAQSKVTRRRSRIHKRSKRNIKRGRGLGTKEIHHGHKGSKLVSFRTKSGKIVRFKVKGKSKRHKS